MIRTRPHTIMTGLNDGVSAFCAALILLCLAVQAVAAPVQEEWADVNGTMLRYEWSAEPSVPADAPVVVLLHEMTLSLESWDYVIEDLRTGYRVLRYDLRGFGLSQKIHGTVTFQQECDDLEALLQFLGVTEPVALVGGALGGATALHFAAGHPAQVLGVLAISPAAGVAPEARPAVLAQADRLEQMGVRAFMDHDLDQVYPEEIRNEQALLKFRALQYANDPGSMAVTWRMIANSEWEDVLPRVRCPAWLVATTLFRVRPPETIRALAVQMPQGQYFELETGHFAALQSPELLLPLLHSFLQSLSLGYLGSE